MCAGIDQSKLTIPFFKQFSHLGLINPSFLLWSLYWTQTSKRLVKYFQIEFIKHKGIVLALGMEFKVVASKLNWNFCKWTTQVHIIPMQTTVGLYNSWQARLLLFPSHPGLVAAVGSQFYHTSSPQQQLGKEPPKLPFCISHSLPQEKKLWLFLLGAALGQAEGWDLPGRYFLSLLGGNSKLAEWRFNNRRKVVWLDELCGHK